MPLVRVFIPLDVTALSALRSSGEVGPSPVAAHCATVPGTRPGVGNDEEDREYAAWSAAAVDAAAAVGEGTRRVIASADVDAAVIRRDDDTTTAVDVDTVIGLSRIASFHIDEEAGGEIGDLLWYDVTELSEVADLVGGD